MRPPKFTLISLLYIVTTMSISLTNAVRAQTREKAYIVHSEGRFVLGNRFMERVLETKGGFLATTVVKNKLADKTIKLSSDEFLLRLGDGAELTGKDFNIVKHTEEDIDGNGKRLSFLLRNDARGIEIRVSFEVAADDFYMRKRLSLRRSEGAAADTAVVVKDIEVERFETEADASLGGLGQPVYLDGCFFIGLEYPAGYNEHKGGLVTLRHYPGHKLEKEPWESKTAVLGVAPENSVEKWFADYVSRIRVKPRSFVVYNSWYDIRRKEITVESLTDRAESFKKNLTKYGVRLDSIVVDDGWQERRSIWEIEKSHLPNGFAPLVDAFKKADTKLGLWLPLTAINGNLDVKWGEAQGYEVSPGARFYCLSGPKYNAALRKVLRRYVEEYHVNYFKHDFNSFSCTSDKHNHLPGAAYGREANVDAEIEMFKFLRGLKPDIYINPSGGLWLSPWWLLYVDTVWMEFCDDFGYEKSVPSLEPRDWAMTYRDSKIYANLRQHKRQFPVSAIMTIGVIYGKRNLLGGKNEPLDRWTDNVMLNFGRGSMLKELYITPSILSDEQWRILAQALKWADENQHVLASGEMLPGRPEKGEVYGYSHFTDDQGIVCLRNPSIKSQSVFEKSTQHIRRFVGGVSRRRLPGALRGIRALESPPTTFQTRSQKITLSLDELKAGSKYVVQYTYPYRKSLGASFQKGDKIEIEIGGYELVVIEAAPAASLVEPTLENLRYSIVSRKPGEMICDVWGDASARAKGSIVSPTPIRDVTVDGEQLAGQSSTTIELNANFLEGSPPIDIVTDPQQNALNVKLSDAAAQSPKFVVLFEGVGKSAPMGKVVINGKEKQVSSTAGDGWIAFHCPLAEKENEINWQLSPLDRPSEPFQSKSFVVSSWLLARRQLAKRRVVLKYDLPKNSAKSKTMLPTPLAGMDTTPIQIQPPRRIDRSDQTRLLAQEDLKKIVAAKLHITVFGSQGGEYGNKPILLNGEEIGRTPTNTRHVDRWQERVIDIPKDKLGVISATNRIVINNLTGDCFKFTEVALAVQLPDATWVESNYDTNIYCSAGGWLYSEGKIFSGTSSPQIVLEFPMREE